MILSFYAFRPMTADDLPTVPQVLIDPSPANGRAIKAYERGFANSVGSIHPTEPHF